MSIDFQEFLKRKTEGSDVRERHRARDEWVAALNRLLAQIEEWIRESDPEGLIEIVPYVRRRAESRLGIYDAPALKLRLNTDEVDVLPIGRYSIGPLTVETREAIRGAIEGGGPAAGRVEITDGERRYRLFRDSQSDPERWLSIEERSGVKLFDQALLEAILQDLWA